jgi:hypothetical protein
MDTARTQWRNLLFQPPHEQIDHHLSDGFSAMQTDSGFNPVHLGGIEASVMANRPTPRDYCSGQRSAANLPHRPRRVVLLRRGDPEYIGTKEITAYAKS